MLLANYAQQNRNTSREIGIGFTNPLAQFREPLFQSFYTPDTLLPGLDSSAFNNGYNTHYCWHLAMKSGGLGSGLNLTGDGSLAGTALAVKLAIAALTGDGSLSATGSLIVQAIAALSGSGGVTAANLGAFLNAVANLTGSGGAAGTLTALGALIAALSGSGGSQASTLTGLGELDADILVTGSGLSTANVGEAVWAAIIESGFSAADILRLIAAVTQGDADGLESGTPAFKSIDGATDRVTGTYSAGTRVITGRDAT